MLTEWAHQPALAPKLEALQAVLRLPDGEIGNAYRKIFDSCSFPANQPFRFIVPAFFHLLQTLAARGRRFGIVIRTFGADIDKGLALELDAFARGEHPLHPDAGAFDGSNGRPDLRVSLSDPDSHGSFYRNAAGTHLVLGTLTRPPPGDGISQVGLSHFEGSGLKIVTGHGAIGEHLAASKVRGMMCFRDYYPWWGLANGKAGQAGKVLYVDETDLSTHAVFFDDHAGRPEEKDGYIVDVRDAAGAPRLYDASVAGVHVVRSEPLDCLSDVEYFVKVVDAAEATRANSARNNGS